MTRYKGRHQLGAMTPEQYDRAAWASFLRELWRSEVARQEYADLTQAEALARMLNIEYQLALRWIAGTQEITDVDVEYVAWVQGYKLELFIELLNGVRLLTHMISFNRLAEEVRTLAAQNPDFVYPASTRTDVCVYNDNGDLPACIFGRALANLGEPASPDDEGRSIRAILMDRGVPLTPEQVTWLDTVQSAQDRGIKWSDAVARANTNSRVFYRSNEE